MAGPIPKRIIRQRDFSAGELVEHAKRRDDTELVRAGARTLSNMRILNTGVPENRPGRTALFIEEGRTDDVQMDSDTSYKFCFGEGTLRIRDSTGAIVAAQGGYDWDVDTARNVVWVKADRDIYLFFRGAKPRIARWDGATTWTFHDFAFREDLQGRRLEPFYRYAAPGVTMQVSALEGNGIDVDFSADVLTDNHVGVRFLYAGKQVEIASVTDGQNGTADVIEVLPKQQILNMTGFVGIAGFAVGDIVVGETSFCEAVILEVDDGGGSLGAGPWLLTVQIIKVFTGFSPLEWVVGPSSRGFINTGGVSDNSPPDPITLWDEAMFSAERGWPGSGTLDQNRLMMCDTVPLPEAWCASRIGLYDDFRVGANPDDPIVDFVKNKARIFHVIGGADLFVFTDRGVLYVPISESNPLIPTAQSRFREITSDPASQIRPVPVESGALYVDASGTRLIAVVPTGQTAQPYITRDVSEYHSHLFSAPFALAVTTGGGPFPERYVWVLNGDGTLAVGKYNPTKEWVGWVPWNREGTGTIEWISASGSTPLLTTLYEPDTGVERRIVEEVDSDGYLDINVAINAVPAAMQAQTEPVFQILPEAGTAIGNMTANGGNAAARDRDTSQTVAQGATHSGTNGFFGVLLTVALPAGKVECWPSSDQGYAQGGSGNITLEYRASNSAPNAGGTNGTLLGSLSLADTTSGPQTVTNTSGNNTAFLYHWVYITQTNATTEHLAEAKFYHAARVLEAPAGGTGDLWFLAGATVKVMDGLYYYGEREVDAAGDLVLIGEEDLSAATVVAGYGWTLELEPFVPHMPEGESVGQTMRPREISDARVAVQLSTGFTFMGRIVSPYRTGENEEEDPPQREEVQEFKDTGSDYDPRKPLTKTTPGTLRVLEISLEVQE